MPCMHAKYHWKIGTYHGTLCRRHKRATQWEFIALRSWRGCRCVCVCVHDYERVQKAELTQRERALKCILPYLSREQYENTRTQTPPAITAANKFSEAKSKSIAICGNATRIENRVHFMWGHMAGSVLGVMVFTYECDNRIANTHTHTFLYR